MNKILVLSKKKDEWKEMEKIFGDVIADGGELFFVDKEDYALEIIQKQHPSLLFIDGFFFDGKESGWEEKKIPLIVVREPSEKKGKEKESLLRPLTSEETLKKAALFLSKEKEEMPVPL